MIGIAMTQRGVKCGLCRSFQVLCSSEVVAEWSSLEECGYDLRALANPRNMNTSLQIQDSPDQQTLPLVHHEGHRFRSLNLKVSPPNQNGQEARLSNRLRPQQYP